MNCCHAGNNQRREGSNSNNTNKGSNDKCEDIKHVIMTTRTIDFVMCCHVSGTIRQRHVLRESSETVVLSARTPVYIGSNCLF